MARWQIELNGQPISMETWPTWEEADTACAFFEWDRPELEGKLAVHEQSEQISVSFGTPPTGGKG